MIHVWNLFLQSDTDHLPEHYKLRGGVYFVNSIPLSFGSKVQRYTVKSWATEWYQKRPKNVDNEIILN